MPIKIGQPLSPGFDEPLGLLSDCHRRIEHFLAVLIALTDAATDAPLTTSARADLEAALTYFSHAAPKHTADEEESLFPRLRASDDPGARQALDVVAQLESDHHVANDHHAAVDAIGRRWLSAGALDPAARRELRERLDALRAIYERHIAVEDRDLFPAAGRILSSSELQAIGREMATRRVAPLKT